MLSSLNVEKKYIFLAEVFQGMSVKTENCLKKKKYQVVKTVIICSDPHRYISKF